MTDIVLIRTNEKCFRCNGELHSMNPSFYQWTHYCWFCKHITITMDKIKAMFNLMDFRNKIEKDSIYGVEVAIPFDIFDTLENTSAK